MDATLGQHGIGDRIAGCLLGGAVGDALGAPVEFMSVAQIRDQFGDDGIQHLAPAYGRIGAITDDTQMTLFTLEGLIRSETGLPEDGSTTHIDAGYDACLRWLCTQGERRGEVDQSSVYSGWLLRQKDLHSRRAPGNSCLSALRSGKIGTVDEPINNSKGCGAVMRMAPVGLVVEQDPFRIGCDLGALTHGHPTGYLAAGFLAQLISEIMHGEELFHAIARAVGRLKMWNRHEECLHAVVSALDLASTDTEPSSAIGKLGEGWVAEEALAISLFCALRAEGFAHGVRLAVNHSGDSDSTGAITGNILGAMWGRQCIPDDLLQHLELREVIEQMALDAASPGNTRDWCGRYGGEHRLTGERMVGSALTLGDTVIHSSLLSAEHGNLSGRPKQPPFPRSYWVVPGQFLAGCYPGDADPGEAEHKLSALLDSGIRAITNLMCEGEPDSHGNPFVPYQEEFTRLAALHGVSVTCIRMPIVDVSTPTKGLMTDILNTIDSHLESGLPTYVHCWGGRGRTGTVVGCWLARHGIAISAGALRHLQHLRRDEETAHKVSPQTPAQCEMVGSWPVGR